MSIPNVAFCASNTRTIFSQLLHNALFNSVIYTVTQRVVQFWEVILLHNALFNSVILLHNVLFNATVVLRISAKLPSAISHSYKEHL